MYAFMMEWIGNVRDTCIPFAGAHKQILASVTFFSCPFLSYSSPSEPPKQMFVGDFGWELVVAINGPKRCQKEKEF